MPKEKEQDEKKPSRHKKFLKFLCIKLPIIIGIIILVMIAALKLVERYPEPLQQGLEQYLSETTHTNATIEKMEKFAFFPNIDIRVQKLTLHDRTNAALVPMSAEYIELIAPIGSVFFNNNRLKNINIKNLKANAGIILPQDIEIETAKIITREGPEQYGSFLSMSGKYAGQKMSFEAEIEKKKNTYYVPKNIPFSLSIGAATLSATLAKGFVDVTLKNAVFSYNNQSAVASDYPIVQSGGYAQDNPLYCLITKPSAADCGAYLKNN